MNITLFFAFFTSLTGDDYLLLSLDFSNTEFFFSIDLLAPPRGLFYFLTSLLSSPKPRFYRTSLLIKTWFFPKMLCSLPSSESVSFDRFYFRAYPLSIDFLLLLITTPSIPFLGIMSNLDLLCPPLKFDSYLGN